MEESKANNFNTRIDSSISAVKEWIKTANPDAIFVLSGGLNNSNDPTPSGFNTKDTKGNTAWGKARAVASKILIEHFPMAKIVTLSRSTNEEPGLSDAGGMTLALQKMTNEDLETIELPTSRDTFSEILEVVNLSLEKKFNRPAVVTTLFQAPRAKAMYDSLINIDNPEEMQKISQMLKFNEKRYGSMPGYSQRYKEIVEKVANDLPHARSIQLDFIPAESTFVIKSDKYQRIINDLKNEPTYLQQLQQDDEGVQQWKAGEYGKSNE